VEGYGKFDDTQVGSQVAAGSGYGIDDFMPDFGGQFFQRRQR
jgi:hypothetical protein